MFWTDLKHTLTHPGFWLYCGLIDTSIKFRNNKMGFLWIFVSSLVFVFVLSHLYHTMLQVPIRQYALHLYAGITVWNLLTNTITQSSSIMETQKNFLSSPNLTFIDLVFRALVQNLIIFFHNFILLIIFVLLFESAGQYAWLLELLVGLIILAVLLISLSILGALISASLPDTKELLNTVFRIGFLATPIIWMVDRVSVIDESRGIVRIYVEFNPFYHMLEIVRGPLLGHDSTHSLLIVIGFILLAFLLISLIYRKQKILMEMSY